MDSHDFDDLLAQGRHIGKLLATIYKDVTGEDLDIESAIKHYPVLALGVAAAAGATAGWWVGKRGRKQLPPPAPESTSLPGPSVNPLQQIGEVLPHTVERMRSALPEVIISDEVKTVARNFFESVLEPKIQENIDGFAANMDARLGALLNRFGQKPESGEDVRLDDPGAK